MRKHTLIALSLLSIIVIIPGSVTAQSTPIKPLGGGSGKIAFEITHFQVGEFSGGGLSLIDTDGQNLQSFPSIKDPNFPDVQGTATNVLWSPDGKRIAFSTGGIKLDSLAFIVEADGSKLVPLGEGMNPLAWSPDGKQLALDYPGSPDPSVVTFCIGKALSLADLNHLTDNGSQSPIFNDPATWCYNVDVMFTSAAFGNWSPDSQSLVFVANSYGLAANGDPPIDIPMQVYRADANGKNAHRLTTDGIDTPLALWSPDGKQIGILQNDQICLIQPGGSNKRCLAQPMPTLGQFDWSPDGKRIAFLSDPTADTSNLYVMNADSTTMLQLNPNTLVIAHPFGLSSFSWSPDGKYLAFAAKCNCQANPNNQIYIIGADGSGLRQLTNLSDGDAEDPIWQP